MAAPLTFSPPPVPGARSLASRMRDGWAGLPPLARDVAVVLLVKAICLWLLWFAFFRHPAAPHMTMETERVAARLAGPAPAAPDGPRATIGESSATPHPHVPATTR